MYIQIIKFDSWVPYVITPQCTLFFVSYFLGVGHECDPYSVVFVQKLLYNAEKNSVKIKEEKTD